MTSVTLFPVGNQRKNYDDEVVVTETAPDEVVVTGGELEVALEGGEPTGTGGGKG